MKKNILNLFVIAILVFANPLFAQNNNREEIANKALEMITDDSDFDTSSFIQYVYEEATNMDIPRTVSIQKSEGQKISIDEIKKGDILFFRNYSFVGIYIGNGEFVYNNGRGDIKKRSIKAGYFKDNLSGARRFINDNYSERKSKSATKQKISTSSVAPEVKKKASNKNTNIASHVLAPVPKNGVYKIGPSYKVKGVKYTPKAKYPFEETGIATWYGPGLYQNKTANGESINKTKLSAAHKTLPLPSVVEVTNLDNGKKVIVRVNDRGPFGTGKILDVSSKAAEIIGLKKTGHAKVKIRLLKKETEQIWKNSPKGKIKWK